jgi:hypothetical protein
MSSPWIITADGRRFDLLCPSLEQVSLRVIAAATAKMCRWTGHIMDFYSVASHSVAVAEICRDAVKPYALLHDAAEGYLGDVATPLKQAMRMLSPAALAAYDQVTETVDRAIHLACGLEWPVPMAIHAEVKHADLAMLATEYRDLIPAGSPPLDYIPPPVARRIVADESWRRSRNTFIHAARDLHAAGLLPNLPGL